MFKTLEKKEDGMRTILEVLSGIYPNRSIKNAVVRCSKLYGKAKKNIRIVSGRLNHDFYEDKDYKIFKSFEKAVESEVPIEIICGPAIDPKTKRIFELCRSGYFKIFQIESKEFYSKVHFSIVDDRHLRLENPHTLSPKLENVEADIVMDAPFNEVKERIDEFDKLKSKAKLTSSPKVEKVKLLQTVS